MIYINTTALIMNIGCLTSAALFLDKFMNKGNLFEIPQYAKNKILRTSKS